MPTCKTCGNWFWKGERHLCAPLWAVWVEPDNALPTTSLLDLKERYGSLDVRAQSPEGAALALAELLFDRYQRTGTFFICVLNDGKINRFTVEIARHKKFQARAFSVEVPNANM